MLSVITSHCLQHENPNASQTLRTCDIDSHLSGLSGCKPSDWAPLLSAQQWLLQGHTIGTLPPQGWIGTPKKPAQDSSRLGNLICADSRIAAHITGVLWSSSARQLRDSSIIVAVTLERTLPSRSFSCHPKGNTSNEGRENAHIIKNSSSQNSIDEFEI